MLDRPIAILCHFLEAMKWVLVVSNQEIIIKGTSFLFPY